jgi:putative transposase
MHNAKRWAKKPAHPTFNNFLKRLLYSFSLVIAFFMSRYRRADISGGTYFFTVVTYRRRAILCDEPVRAALRKAVKTVQSRHPFAIDAWVLLPDHLHTIWTLPPGDANFSMRWGLIKRLVTMACADDYHQPDWMTASKTKHRESTFWQRRYWEHLIRDEADFQHHVDYVHVNPLKHGYVKQVADWPFSTFHRFVENGVYPLNWCGDLDALVAGDG